MVPDQVIERHTALCSEINRHNTLYYVEANPEITDDEFQALMDELLLLEKSFPEVITPDSPSQRVGGTSLTTFESVEYEVPMLSLDNTYNDDELRAFDKRVRSALGVGCPEYVVELKIDGVSLSLRYDSGILTRAVTRGDGKVGDDITANIKTIKTIPNQISGEVPDVLVVRGEVYMTKAELERLNVIREQAGEPLLSNPRNTTAGTLKTLDPVETSKRNLEVAFYDVAPTDGAMLTTHINTLSRIEAWGLPVNPFYKQCSGIEEVLKVCSEWVEKRHTLGFEIDGMVVKVDDASYRTRLGATSKAPRWAIAYKYPAEIATTKLESITVQVGKTGALTPVANLSPVRLAGTIVKRASLYNFDYLKTKDIRVGDTVMVQKAGEIIPQVLGPVFEDRPRGIPSFEVPKTCPSCGSKVVKDPEQVCLQCLNPSCPAQIKQRIKHFSSRKAMYIEGLGESLIDKLINEKIISSFVDIYTLNDTSFGDLYGIGKKTVKNLISAIDTSRSRPLNKLLYAIGIRYVGENTSKILADHYGDIDKIMSATESELFNVSGIGEKASKSISEFFSVAENKKLVDDLRKAGVLMQHTAVDTEFKPLSGAIIVVSGTLRNYTRDSISEKIKELGGQVSSSVSSKTSFLLLGESDREKLGKKSRDAIKYGVDVIREEDFEKIIRGEGTECNGN